MKKKYINFQPKLFNVIHKDKLYKFELENLHEIIDISQKAPKQDILDDFLKKKYIIQDTKQDLFYFNIIRYAYFADIMAHVLSYALTCDKRHLDFFFNENKAPLWMGTHYDDFFKYGEQISFIFKYYKNNDYLNYENSIVFTDSITYSNSLLVKAILSETGLKECPNVSLTSEEKENILAMIIKKIHKLMDFVKQDRFYGTMYHAYTENIYDKKYFEYVVGL